MEFLHYVAAPKNVSEDIIREVQEREAAKA
jgi:hypothetical protein